VRHNHRVTWRRFLLFAVLLVLATSFISAIAPRERRASQQPRSELLPATPPASVVHGSLPGDREVRARVGDVIALSVSAPAADVVEVPTLALEEPVDDGLPAQLVFVADRAGRFRVRLRDAGEAVGTLQIDS
jgi:hypothetical protein